MPNNAITIESLEAAGVADALGTYEKIAQAGGFGSFGPGFKPALDLSGLPEDTQKTIERIIAAARKEK